MLTLPAAALPQATGAANPTTNASAAGGDSGRVYAVDVKGAGKEMKALLEGPEPRLDLLPVHPDSASFWQNILGGVHHSQYPRASGSVSKKHPTSGAPASLVPATPG
jgi:hypothetical protein